MSDNAPGWQPDPTGRFEHRYWDGSQWTDHVSNAGVASTDAYSPGWGNPTVAQPAAPGDPTATWPATPAPPSFTPPVPTSGGVAGAPSGSKKRLLIGGGILAAIAIAVIALLSMGGDGGSSGTTDTTDADGSNPLSGDLPPDFEQQLADAYGTGMGLSEEKAECLAGKIASAIESGELDQEQAMSDIFGYLADCDIDMSELSGN